MRLLTATFVIGALLFVVLSAAAKPAWCSLSVQACAAKHDQDVIRFFLHHPRLAAKPAGQRALWRILHRLSLQIRTLQAARAWPEHHALWLCIHGGEGLWDDPNSGNNGHYGGLQMTPGWGSMPDGATANNYSQLEQERNAETEYAKNGYSRDWLRGQWGQTIGPCWSYAK